MRIADAGGHRQRPDWLAPPTTPPIPKWPVWWRVAALFGFVILGYNVAGTFLAPWLQATMYELCVAADGLPCATGPEGVTVGGSLLPVELYWLPGIWSLVGLVIFVFPGPAARRALAGAAAILATSALWALQVGSAVVVSARGWLWAANMDYGPVAVVVAFVSFVAGFVILISIMLAGRSAQAQDQATNDPNVGNVEVSALSAASDERPSSTTQSGSDQPHQR